MEINVEAELDVNSKVNFVKHNAWQDEQRVTGDLKESYGSPFLI